MASRLAAFRLVVVLACWLVVALCAGWASAQDVAGRKLALVIGNSNYRALPALANPDNDAMLVANALHQEGFEVVLRTDLDLAGMRQALDTIAAGAKPTDHVVFYYAGHGFQIDGVNYIVPVDAVLDSRDVISKRTVRLDDIMASLTASGRQTMMFIDACRDNPLPASLRDKSANGLAEMQQGLSNNAYVMFATGPGQVSVDGNGRDSPFAIALAQQLVQPNQSISTIEYPVRDRVAQLTSDLQVPTVISSLRADFYFNGGLQTGVTFGQVAMAAPPPPPPPPSQGPAAAPVETGIMFGAPSPGPQPVPPLAASVQVPPPVAPVQVPPPVAVASASPPTPTPAVAPRPPEQAATANPAPAPQLPVPRPAPKEIVAQEQPMQVASIGTPTGAGRGIEPAPVGTPGPAAASPDTATVPTVAPAKSAPAVEAAASQPSQGAVAVSGSEAPVSAGIGGEAKAADQPTQIAAIEPGQALNPVQSDTAVISGVDVTPPPADTNTAPADKGATAPDNLPATPPETAPATPPVDYASKIQTELLRVGCYNSTVDGIWGAGSRAALARYFDAKKVSDDATDPTEAIYIRLANEPGKVCRTERVAVDTPSRPVAEPATPRPIKRQPAPVVVQAAPRAAPPPAASAPSLSTNLLGVFR